VPAAATKLGGVAAGVKVDAKQKFSQFAASGWSRRRLGQARLMQRVAELQEQALETMENVLVALRRMPDRNDAVQRVIDDIEDQRAKLLASQLMRPN
jgi:hypothetical protein